VASALDDYESAPIRSEMKLALAFLEHFVPHNGQLEPSHIHALKEGGLSRDQIQELMNIAWCFLVISRWADTLNFPVTDPKKFRLVGRMMYRFGYGLASV